MVQNLLEQGEFFSSLLERLLRTVPMYANLNDEDVSRLARVARSNLYVRGQRLFGEGDSADRFHTIIRGRVKVFRTTPGGKDMILTILGPGDPVGAVAVYRNIPFPASAEALEDTVTITIRRQDFYELLERTPSLVLGLLQGLTRRLIELTNRLSVVTGSRVEPRFARLFLKLAQETGRDHADGIRIPVRLSRQELADLTGTTIETCIRIMSRWGKQDVVRTDDNGFIAVDMAVLEHLGDS